MSKTKFAFLYKYIFLLAILALLFSVSFSFARYATSASSEPGVDIDEFNIDVHLYHESSTISGSYDDLIDTLPSVMEDLSTYTDTYYLTITNNDRYTLYYSFSELNDNFIFSSVTEYSKKTDSTSYTKGGTSSPNVSTYVGKIEPVGTEGATTTALELHISVNPSVTILSGEEQKLAIKFYLVYQHTAPYEQADSIDSSMDGTTLSGDYCLTSDLYLTSGLTFDGISTLSLNGYTISGGNSSSSNLNLISVLNGASLTIEDYVGNGSISGGYNALYLNSGSSCLVTGGTITKAYNSGVYVASGASLTLSGSPVITGSGLGGTERNVYFFGSSDTITLGELKEGANIGVSRLTGTGQITSTETDTYYYESAIKYIHADGSNYKVVAGHSGYLSLVSHGFINFTVALHGTSGSTHNIPSSNQSGDFNGAFNIDGGSVSSKEASKDSGWKGADSSYFSQQSLSSYSGTYAYDYYYDFGSVSSSLEFTFAVCPYTWETSLYNNGLAPSDSDFSTKYNNDSNFFLWGNQHNAGTEEQDWNDYTASMWGLEFNNMGTDAMDGIGDFTIVLELDYSSLDTNWSDNNIVSNVYFIVDGMQQNLV